MSCSLVDFLITILIWLLIWNTSGYIFKLTVSSTLLQMNSIGARFYFLITLLVKNKKICPVKLDLFSYSVIRKLGRRVKNLVLLVVKNRSVMRFLTKGPFRFSVHTLKGQTANNRYQVPKT
jgi:hypothetical protein